MNLSFRQGKFVYGSQVITDLNEVMKLYDRALPVAKNILDHFKIHERPLVPWKLKGGRKPLPFQPEVIDWILTRSRSYAAVWAGGGKCCITYTCINARPGKALILCPPYLWDVWAVEQAQEWLEPEAAPGGIYVATDGPFDIKKAHSASIVIMPDSRLADSVHILKEFKWEWLIVDEAHRYNNAETGRGKALWDSFRKKQTGEAYGPLVWFAENVVLLSGTPMPNGPMDLYACLSVMNPEAIRFMNRNAFGATYCNAVWNGHGHDFKGEKNTAALNRALTNRLMIVVDEATVKANLPPVVEEVVKIHLPTPQPDIAELDEIITSKFATQEAIFAASDREEPHISRNRVLVGAAKTQFVLERLIDELESDPDKKIIVFAAHSVVMNELEIGLQKFGVVRICGKVPKSKRPTLIKDFRTSRTKRVCLGNIKAMTLGYTIIEAEETHFAEYLWTDADNSQARDRAHRTGQKKTVRSVFYVLAETLDESVLRTALAKRKRASKIIRRNDNEI